ncbi:MAG TPA: hypothetical protein QGF58_12395 [Myxococcota bacterium]|nr:hypothetical protein [Myxococcota bacterium]
MFDQIRAPRRGPGLNRAVLFAAVVLMLLSVVVIGFGSFWVLASLGLTIGPSGEPVEVWYDPYEDGTEPP